MAAFICFIFCVRKEALAKVHFELIPNMYELGLFKRALESRRRLRITALCALLGLTAIYACVGWVVHYVSLSALLNFLLIIFVYILSLFVGYLCALVFGDIYFAGPWRKKMILGAKYIPEDLEEQQALLRNKNGHFIIVWFVCVVALGAGCDFVTGGHIRWYQSIGGVVHSLQSPDASERAHVLKTISNPYHSERWEIAEIRDLVRVRILDEDSEVRAWASYLAGKSNLSEGADDLMQVLKAPESSSLAKQEAAIALGRMEWKPARALLLSTLRESFNRDHGDKEVVPAIFYAFYEMKDGMAATEAVNILDLCLEKRDCSSEILQYGFFYLKSMKVKAGAKLSFKYLSSSGLSDEMRCYATDILRFTASAEDVPAMKREFEKAPVYAECPVVYRKYHQEAAIILFEADPLRALLVRAIGNMMNPDDFDWIWVIGSNASEHLTTRKVAEIYTRAMKDRKLVK